MVDQVTILRIRHCRTEVGDEDDQVDYDQAQENFDVDEQTYALADEEDDMAATVMFNDDDATTGANDEVSTHLLSRFVTLAN